MPDSNVRRINGVEVTGTPVAGDVPTATSATAAAWTAPGSGVLGGAVILAPASSTRNVVTPTGDFKNLIIKGRAAQSVSLQEWQLSTGTAVMTVQSGASPTSRIFMYGAGTPAVVTEIDSNGVSTGLLLTGSTGTNLIVTGAGGISASGSSSYGVKGSSAASNSGLFLSSDNTNTAGTLVTKAIASGTADLFQSQDSSAAIHTKIDSGHNLIVNETGANNIQFRVEGDTDANLIYTSPSDNRIGVGTNNPLGKLHVSGTANAVQVWVSKYVGAVNDTFVISDDSANKEVIYGAAGAIFNEQGNSALDFRIEGDAKANLVFVDASADCVGINNSAPVSILDVNGSVGAAIVTKTTDYTATADDWTILCDATAGNMIITLPAVAGCARRVYNIKKIDSSGNTVTIDGNASETIDGATTKVISTQYVSHTIQSNGSAWYLI